MPRFLGASFTTTEIIQDLVPVCQGRVRIQRCDGDVGGAESGNLVVHESEQGRDDDGDAVVDDRWQLVAQAFTKRGGCGKISD